MRIHPCYLEPAIAALERGRALTSHPHPRLLELIWLTPSIIRLVWVCFDDCLAVEHLAVAVPKEMMA